MISADSIAVRNTLQRDTLSKQNTDYQQQTADSVSVKPVVEHVFLDSVSVVFPVPIHTFETVSAQTMFGDEAISVNTQPAPRQIANVGRYDGYFDFGYQSILLVVFILYIIAQLRFWSVSKNLFKAIWRNSYIDKFITEKSINVQIFLDFTAIIGTLGTMIAACDLPLITGVQLPQMFGIEGRIVFPIAAAAALFVLTIYKRLLCKVIGAFSTDRYFAEDLHIMRRVFNAICSMLITPLIFAGSFTDERVSLVIYAIAAICLVISIFAYLIKMRKIFLVKKISSLQWFLYLCTVEILPLSFLLLLLLRGA